MNRRYGISQMIPASAFLLASFLLAAMPATSFAQCVGGCSGCELFTFDGVAEPVEVQGPIQSITADGVDAIVVVMGVTIRVTPSTPTIASTANDALTIDQLTDPTPFPGRSEKGFVGGTGIVQMDGRNPSTEETCAIDVFVERGEHTLGGPLDENGFSSDFLGFGLVMGQEIQFANDARLGRVSITDTGLTLDPSTARLGGLTSMEGYFGEDGVLYMAVFEAPGESPMAPEVSVARAQCRQNNGRLRALGGSTAATGVVEIFDADVEPAVVSLGTADVTAVAIGDLEQGGEWRFQEFLGANQCPAQIRVTQIEADPPAAVVVTVVADVDIRE